MVYNVCAVLGPSQHPYIRHREIHGIWGRAPRTRRAQPSYHVHAVHGWHADGFPVIWVPYAAPRLQTRTWHVVSIVPVIEVRVRCHSDN